MDAVECSPKCLLGWPIKSKTQIWFNWIIPISLELFVYVVLIVADVAVTYQHFIDGNHLWAWITLTFIWLPAILCFCSIITSPWNWPDYHTDDNNEGAPNGDGGGGDDDADDGANKQCLQFILILAFNVLLFAIGALARFGRRLFWSIEALFHDEDSYERHQSLSKAAENSAFELYHFLQAFAQAAPQLLLQLYILLNEDIFRNYDTTTVQAISIVFSLLQMAIIAEGYQRFESQKIVGRNYPWHPVELCQERKETLQRRTVAPRQPQSLVKTPTITEFPEVMLGFNDNDSDTPLSPATRSGGGETAAGQVFPTSPTIEVECIRKTLHVDDNNFDGEEKLSRRKSSLASIMQGTEWSGSKRTAVGLEPGWDDIEIDGHAEPISVRKDGGKKALPADVDKIKLWQSTSLSTSPSSSPAAAGINGRDGRKRPKDEPRAPNFTDPNMTKEEQLSKDHHDHDDQEWLHRRRRRPSYLAEGRHTNEDNDGDDDDNFDTSPTTPPPPLPTTKMSFNKILNYPLNRLSTITDMLLLDTELYVKDHVPRLPERIARHEFKSHLLKTAEAHDDKETSSGPTKSLLIDGDGAVEKSIVIKVHSSGEEKTTSTTYSDGNDDVDGNVLMMPRRRRMIVGLEQEDFFAKTVGFLGWFFFILARVLSISVFATLHWREAIYICMGHYLIVLLCLFYEVKLKAKASRLLFYLFLSYAYVFVILEFKIKFLHLRMWYGLYVGLVLTQNFVLSVWWYVAVMDFELWWFDYLFRTILGSGALSLCCLLVYYLRLKPKDKVLFELMEESETTTNGMANGSSGGGGGEDVERQ